MKLLCLADIHLGAQLSRKVPVSVLANDRRHDFTPKRVWRDAVDMAIKEEVDAVLIAGDVVEHDDDFNEAYVDLDRETNRLVTHGIRVIAIAGNHDSQVLPRLAETIRGFELLGPNGTWGRTTVTAKSGLEVDIVGWSMPNRYHRGSPFDHYDVQTRGVPTIGMLHGDRDVSGSEYAPFATQQLRDAGGIDAWILGHIHKPDFGGEPTPMGYLGSPIGLDPGEPGGHGVWMVTHDSGKLRFEHRPIAPIRWETIDLDVTGLADTLQLEQRVVEALSEMGDRLLESEWRPQVVACEVRLMGRSNLRREFRRLLDGDRSYVRETRDMTVFAYRFPDDTRPDFSIDEIARGADQAAVLARQVQILETPSEQRDALVRRVLPSLNEQSIKHFGAHELAEPPSGEEAVALLRRAAIHALDLLMSSRGG